MTESPWHKNYAPGVPATVDIPDHSLVDLLDASVTRFGDHVALDFYGSTMTYTALGEQVAKAAQALHDVGVKAGDRVALVLPNCPQHVVAFYAVLRLGAIVVEHNPLYTSDELQVQLADHGARVAIVWDKTASVVQHVARQTKVETVIAVDLTTALPGLKRFLLRLPVPSARATRVAMTAPAPGAPSWEKLVAKAAPLDPTWPRPGHTDVALLQYTGGTTGTPKGAILTHRNLLANALQGRAWVPGLVDGEETIYAVLPLFHAYGLTLCLTFAVSIGATLVLFPRFDLDQVLEAMERKPATFLPAVPPIYQQLAVAARDRGVSLTSVRYGISGAMALPVETVALWEDVSGGLLVEGYGMTESSPVALGNPASPNRRAGTIGVPFPSTEMRVVDRDDSSIEMPYGERGELLIRGPQVFSGYWQQPEESARVLLADGWLRTGDVVEVDANGFVTIVDRIKELIITGGFNVYPSEVEAALRKVDGVLDAAAVGLPLEGGGEEVVAAVVAEEGVELDPDAVRQASREHLTGYKVPRRVVVVDELPRSLIGKVLHRQVRDALLFR
ncbi:MAG: long-chain-fatty-acid--CoA ligase [Ornithinibacter sp.]